MMARQTGSEAEFNALLREAEKKGAEACRNYFGLASWDVFYTGSLHPQIRDSFRIGWKKEAEVISNEQ